MFKNIVVVGMGYVGIPVAVEFARVGFDVIGINRSRPKVDMINNAECPIKGNEPELPELLTKVVKEGKLKATQEFSVCKDADAILIAVQTPFNVEEMKPKYESLESAVRDVGRNLSNGTLVIIESTIAPTTMEKVVKPILEKESGLKAGEEFYLGNCPERVTPGKLLKNIRELNRAVGGINEQTRERMIELYKHIVKAELYPTNCLTAEVVKTAENAYRDVQIAFANEIAMICSKFGIDVFEVRELVNKCPYRDMHLPGAGVGGHCLPKDSWLLTYGIGDKYDPKMLKLGREINDNMPFQMLELIEAGLTEVGIDKDKSTVSIMGLAYLEESDDIRNSPAFSILDGVKKMGARYYLHDPFVEEFNGEEITKDIDEVIKNSDCIVIVTAHDVYRQMKIGELKEKMKGNVIIDGRNVFNKTECKENGFIYRGIGK